MRDGVDPFRIRHPVGAELQLDMSPAQWILGRFLPWVGVVDLRVCAVVPTGYEAYVRIFHQADERGGRVGSLDRERATSLIDILRAHTATDDCWLAIWHGYAFLHGSPATGMLVRWEPGLLGWIRRSWAQYRNRIKAPSDLESAPTISLPAREYYLYRASIDVVPRFEFMPGDLQTPNMWWPQDRAWFVGTEIDLDSTLVACKRSCAGALLASGLAALEVAPDTSLGLGDDPR
jgi:hypothetical protein